MKKLLVLLFLLLPFVASAASLADSVNAMNYPLSRVMRPHQTYTGILVDAQDVTVMSGPKGLIGGLTLGLANFAFGSNLGAKKLTVHQYVVRLDQPDDARAEVITVIQGGGALVESGTPVFLVTQTSYDGTVFSVRMIAAKTPEVYGTTGMEESRRDQRRREIKASQANTQRRN
jgi:hypothetical protein